MASLVDTNVLVYRYDPRFPAKQRVASRLLREGLVAESLVLPHQAIVELVAVVTRPRPELGGLPLLAPEEARVRDPFLEAAGAVHELPSLYDAPEPL